MKKNLLLIALLLAISPIANGQSTLKAISESIAKIENVQSEILMEASVKYKRTNISKIDSLSNLLISSPIYENIPTSKIIEFQALSDSLSYQLFLESQLINSIIQSLNKIFVSSTFLNRDFTKSFIKNAKKTKDNSVKVFCIESINSTWLEIMAYKNNINNAIDANKLNSNIALLSGIFIDLNSAIDKLNENYFKPELRDGIRKSNDKANKYLIHIQEGISQNSEELVLLTNKCSKSISELYSMNYRKLELTVPKEVFSIIN